MAYKQNPMEMSEYDIPGVVRSVIGLIRNDRGFISIYKNLENIYFRRQRLWVPSLFVGWEGELCLKGDSNVADGLECGELFEVNKYFPDCQGKAYVKCIDDITSKTFPRGFAPKTIIKVYFEGSDKLSIDGAEVKCDEGVWKGRNINNGA